jgi:hypothetical protein
MSYIFREFWIGFRTEWRRAPITPWVLAMEGWLSGHWDVVRLSLAAICIPAIVIELIIRREERHAEKT